ncbi:MAG: YggS family pyridoxal phosphate-dependent enzyme [Nitrospira sp.]|nr:YggS family pyridoxal phosphate-dependent enzyme [Nitrospira sp.]
MTDSLESSVIARNVRTVLDRIRQAALRVGRQPDSVRLVAVTKSVSSDHIRPAIEAGVKILGENRLQEAIPKMAAIGPGDEVRWHFIGRLQRRKVKAVVGKFQLIHSVDSVELAVEINRRAEEAGLIQEVLLEVNIAGESSKGGFAPGELPEALAAVEALPNLSVKGLMVVPPLTTDPERTRPHFRAVRDLARSLVGRGLGRIGMEELSMGMSHDYEVAVEEGATLVRVGTAIFGARHA